MNGSPKLVALKRTSLACPSQWEGTLEDGQAVYIRYRHGHLSIGVGDDIDMAVGDSMSDQAFFATYVGDRLDGFMDFEELASHLGGLLERSPDLIVENERPPGLDPKTLAELFGP